MGGASSSPRRSTTSPEPPPGASDPLDLPRAPSPYSARYPHHQRPTLPRERTIGRHHLQFGVQFFPAVDHTDKSAADYYAESLAIAEEAETLGLTHARTVEHYFTRYGGHSHRPTP